VTLTRAARLYIALVIAAIASFGLPLYLYPMGAPSYWAWTVAVPRTAMLIGSIYFVSTLYYIYLYRQTEWLRVELSLRSLFVVAAWLLVAAMFHWTSFYPYRPLALAWLAAYYLPLFFLPILFRLQQEQFGDPVPPPPWIGAGWRLFLRLRALAFALLALALFVEAPALTATWPWPIETVNLRMLSGQLAVFGAFAGVAMKEGAWQRLRPFMIVTAMLGLAHLPAYLPVFGPYSWTSPLSLFPVLVPLEWLATSLALLAAHRGR